MKKQRSTLAQRRLRARRAKLDVQVGRVRRKVKTLTRRLKVQQAILKRRMSRRAALA